MGSFGVRFRHVRFRLGIMSPMTKTIRSTPIHVEQSTSVDNAIACAIVACARVLHNAIAVASIGAKYLRAAREAGRLLSLGQRSDGGRPYKNSSRGLTSYQFALQQAGITRQTANVWRRCSAGSRARMAARKRGATRRWGISRNCSNASSLMSATRVIVADPTFAPMYNERSRRVKTDRRDVAALADAC